MFDWTDLDPVWTRRWRTLHEEEVAAGAVRISFHHHGPIANVRQQNRRHIEDFTIRNVPERVTNLGDLWKPLLEMRGRFDLRRFV